MVGSGTSVSLLELAKIDVPGIEEVGNGAQVRARAGNRARLTGALLGTDTGAFGQRSPLRQH